MTNDLISQAEVLIEKHSTSGYIHRDATLLLPGLVEEIKHLRVLECAAKANMTRRDEDIGDLMKELAKWQQIAIKQRALINFIETEERYAYSEHVILSDDEILMAAKELGLQYTFKTTHGVDGPIEINGEKYVKESEQKAYAERLERLALSICIEAGWDQEDFEAALEKIRRR